ncbi:MAG: hypothetical protein WCZ47_00640 [Bacilli bacterium]|nr:hypothetical protein [Erysipelotrichia bacterium]
MSKRRRVKPFPYDLKTLIAMQLKDKLDLGFVKNKGQLIRKIVFFILRFIIVGVISFALFYVASFFKIFHNSPFLPTSLMTIVLTIIFVISTITSSNELLKSLYLAKDNALLVTYPTTLNKVFFSKIVVYYLYELYKNFTFVVPIFLAYGLLSPVSPFFYLWVLVTFFVVTLIPVILGVVISIPLFYINVFLNRVRFLKTVVFITLLSLFIWLVVEIILLIPPRINILFLWEPIKAGLSEISIFFQKYFVFVYYIVVMIFGKLNTSRVYSYLSWEPWLIFFSTIFILGVLFMLAYYVSRFIFLKMISQGDSYGKSLKPKAILNVRHSRFITFIIKEVRLLLRNGEFAYNFLATYISIPIIILLVNQIFAGMDLYVKGQFFVQAFNVLLILLPLLASNGLIATMYSKEARTAYMKRTKPVNALIPLFAKLIPNLVLSLTSIVVSLIVFNIYMNFIFINIFLLALGMIFIQVGHLFLSGLLDLMNPQNEQYATTGTHVQNPNETKSIILAFVIAFAYALITLAFILEAVTDPSIKFSVGFLKMFFIGLGFALIVLYLYKENIKVYYNQRVES